MVLENCLDKAVEVLFDGLEKNVLLKIRPPYRVEKRKEKEWKEEGEKGM
jgi:hypothetical protein